jgi:flagellar basal-body rod protein FlgG
MLRGLYNAGCGMMAQAARTEVIANNLANSNTAGFKRDNVAFRSFPEMLLYRINDGLDQSVLKLIPQGSQGQSMDIQALIAMLSGNPPTIGGLNTGVVVDEVRTLQESGNLLPTQRKLDLAIAGEGMFVVETSAGEGFTRNGCMNIAVDGFLVNGEGLPFLGVNGPININPAVDSEDSLEISETGEVLLNGNYLDRLRVVTFDDYTQLRKQGDSIFKVSAETIEPANVFQPQIKVGYIERSNVNPVEEMVALIEVSRAYEANQKVVQAYDSTLDKAVNEVGKV